MEKNQTKSLIEYEIIVFKCPNENYQLANK